MLEKFLPSLFKQKNDLNQKNLDLPQQKRNDGEDSLESGFNLVSTSQSFYVVPKYAAKLIPIIRNLIILLSVLFGVVLIINFGASQIIKVQKDLQTRLLKQVEEYADVEIRAKELDAKTVAYKKFLGERKKLLPKSKFVMDNIGSNIRLNNLKIDHEGFTISFSGSTALDFTNLIVRYLEGDMISEILINSASLDRKDGGFRVTLRGTFK